MSQCDVCGRCGCSAATETSERGPDRYRAIEAEYRERIADIDDQLAHPDRTQDEATLVAWWSGLATERAGLLGLAATFAALIAAIGGAV